MPMEALQCSLCTLPLPHIGSETYPPCLHPLHVAFELGRVRLPAYPYMPGVSASIHLQSGLLLNAAEAMAAQG